MRAMFLIVQGKGTITELALDALSKSVLKS